MKKRTPVFAWIYAIGAGLGIIRYGPTAIVLLIQRQQVHRELVGWAFVVPVANLLLLGGWLGILDRRIWAWRLLVMAYTIAAVVMCASITMFSFLLRGHTVLSLLFLGFLYIMPLWVLLTDRPSGWSQPDDPQSETPIPQ